MSDTRDAGWVCFLQLLPTVSQTGCGDPGFPDVTQERCQMAEEGQGSSVGGRAVPEGHQMLGPAKGTRGKMSCKVEGGAGQNDLPRTDCATPHPLAHVQEDRVVVRAWAWLALHPGCFLLDACPWASQLTSLGLSFHICKWQF